MNEITRILKGWQKNRQLLPNAICRPVPPDFPNL